MRKRFAAFLLLSLACSRTEDAVPPPTPESATETTATTATAPAAPQTGWQPALLAGALNTDAAKKAQHPDLAVGADNLPVVSWIEDRSVLAAKWNGSGWTRFGGAANRTAGTAVEQSQLSVQSDATALLAWIESTPPNGTNRAAVARWNGAAWEAVGDYVTGATSVCSAVRLVSTPAGPVVATSEQMVNGPSGKQLIVRRWNGTTWQQLGSGALNAVAGSDIGHGPVMAAAGDDVFVGWVEYISGQPPATQMRKWDSAQNGWRNLPALSKSDHDTTLSMGAAADGTLVVGQTWNPGFYPFVKLPPAPGANWVEIGLPDNRLAGEWSTAHRVAIAPDGAVVTMIQTRDGLLRIDRLDGTVWTPVAAALNPQPRHGEQPLLAVSPDGAIHAGYIDTRDGGRQLLVHTFRKTQ